MEMRPYYKRSNKRKIRVRCKTSCLLSLIITQKVNTSHLWDVLVCLQCPQKLFFLCNTYFFKKNWSCILALDTINIISLTIYYLVVYHKKSLVSLVVLICSSRLDVVNEFLPSTPTFSSYQLHADEGIVDSLKPWWGVNSRLLWETICYIDFN